MGHGEGRLRPAQGAYGRNPYRARRACRRLGKMCLDLAAARARRPHAEPHACLQQEADHRAGALFARPRPLRRIGDGHAAGRPQARRHQCRGRGPVRRRARRFFRVGRRQSGPSGAVQRQPLHGLRPDAAARADRDEPRQEARRGEEARAIPDRLLRLRLEGAAAALPGGRSEGTLLQARTRRNSATPFTRRARAGSAPTVTARNTAIRCASASSSRWRTGTAR